MVNGRAHAVGSDQEAIDRLIEDGVRHGRLSVPVTVETMGESIVARVGQATAPGQTRATVWLVRFSLMETVTIARGENTGRSVTYAHVVKDMQPIGMWKGLGLSLELPRTALTDTRNAGYALIVQMDAAGRPGPIIGAATIGSTTSF